MERLKRRTDFRAVAQAAGQGSQQGARAQLRAHASAFTLQARPRGNVAPPRVGFTVSKQVGNAVERNRVRRRLRELIRLAPAGALCDGHDYVLIGRRAALKAAFDAMKNDLSGALHRVHGFKSGLGKGGSDEGPGKGSGKSGSATGAAVEPPPHRAGPAKDGSGKRQMGPEPRADQHEH